MDSLSGFSIDPNNFVKVVKDTEGERLEKADKTNKSNLTDVVRTIGQQTFSTKGKTLDQISTLEKNLIAIRDKAERHNNSIPLTILRLFFNIEGIQAIETQEIQRQIHTLKDRETELLKEQFATLSSKNPLTHPDWTLVKEQIENLSPETFKALLQDRQSFLETNGNLPNPENNLFISYSLMLKQFIESPDFKQPESKDAIATFFDEDPLSIRLARESFDYIFFSSTGYQQDAENVIKGATSYSTGAFKEFFTEGKTP